MQYSKTKQIALFTMFVLLALSESIPSQALLRIKENGLWGYINYEGTVVIKPEFAYAREFSEGLAAVRKGGYYGFIDSTGNFVLKEQYDYAEDFNGNFALVYLKDHPNIIRRDGSKLIPFVCFKVGKLKEGKITVYTEMRKAGVIDTLGTLIADTIYSSVSEYSNGLAVTTRYDRDNRKDGYGVIDSIGNLVVKIGIYDMIGPFHNGFARVNWNSYDMDRYSIGYINRIGELVFSDSDAVGFETSEVVSYDSLFLVTQYEHIRENNSHGVGNKIVSGLMNFEGVFVREEGNGVQFKTVDDEIYAVDTFKRYSKIDRLGDPIGRKFFIGEHHIRSNFKVADSSGKWGLIDTNLNFVIQPFYDIRFYMEAFDDYFFFGTYVNNEDGKKSSKWGVCTVGGMILFSPEFNDVDYRGFKKGILKIWENGVPGYVDVHGNRLWFGKKWKPNTNQDLDIDYQLETRYVTTKNWPGLLPEFSSHISDNSDFPDNEITLILEKNEDAIFAGRCRGLSLILTNNRDEEATVPSTDGAIYLILQAIDYDGKWKSIEITPRSSCGVSYSQTKLPSRIYWKFVIPSYSGSIKTKIRATLEITLQNGKSHKVLSNVIEGSVNPAQFWRDRGFWFPLDFLEK